MHRSVSRRQPLRTRLTFLSAPLLLVGLVSCGSASPSEPRPQQPVPVPEPAEVRWELVWADEFEVAGPPDASRWALEEGRIRNQEAQFYTRGRAENARVEGGMLVIEARKERHAGANYTSASVTTAGKASWTYGRIEVRAKLPSGRGMWPAIWMLGTNINQVGWPASGEIDIMENVGFDPHVIHANVHTTAFNHAIGTNQGARIDVPNPDREFHVYAVEWFPNRMEFFVDNRRYFTFFNSGRGPAEWPFDDPQYLILNVAVGGTWGGQQGIDESVFPQKFHIDYVRVYKQVK